MKLLTEELRATMATADLEPDICLALTQWYDARTAPAYKIVNPQLRESCFRAGDKRLAEIPFPSHAVPVPTDPLAPLPKAPDQRLIPPHIKYVLDVLKPETKKNALTARSEAKV